MSERERNCPDLPQLRLVRLDARCGGCRVRKGGSRRPAGRALKWVPGSSVPNQSANRVEKSGKAALPRDSRCLHRTPASTRGPPSTFPHSAWQLEPFSSSEA